MQKKRKVESLPSVVMLRLTFVILKSMRKCIEFRLHSDRSDGGSSKKRPYASVTEATKGPAGPANPRN